MSTVRAAIVKVLMGLIFVVRAASMAHADFATIINVPPDVPPTVISSNTQVNVGGALGDRVDAGSSSGTSTNIEVNIRGMVGNDFDAFSGSTINLFSGFIGISFDARAGSHFNMSGGSTGVGFTAWNGSEVVLTEGQLGQLVAYAGSTVTVHGGSIGNTSSTMGQAVGAFSGPAVLNLLGGHVTHSFDVREHGVVNMSGGRQGALLHAYPGSILNISGGTVGASAQIEGELNFSGGFLDSNVDARAGSDVTISGGVVGPGFQAHSGSSVTLSGGELIYELDAEANASVELIGSEFLLDGAPIPGLAVGVPFVLPDRGGVLSGVFATGQSFDFELVATSNVFNRDYFDAQAVLTLTLVFLPGDFDRSGAVDSSDYDLWRSEFGTAASHVGDGADGNYDGIVDAADYVVWRRHLGQPIPSATMQNLVPEPASFYFAVATVIAAISRRRS